MDNPLETELYRAAARTFEELGYMLPMPDEEPGERQVDVVASVAFHGPRHGRVLVGCPGGLLPALAANMTGEDEVASGVQQLDALMEVTNVICGNFLPAVAGSSHVFRMQAPEVFEAALLPGLGPPRVRTTVVLDEGWAEVMLFIDG